MKNSLFLVGILTATFGKAQTGLINFQNDPSTKVSNAFTRTWVTTNDALQVQLYVAADLSTEDFLTAFGAPTSVITFGHYGSTGVNGNIRTGDWAGPGSQVMIQVR